jgi:hypothetical protein
VLVPDGEAELAEEIHAVDLGGEIRGVRIGQEPGREQRGRERRGQRAADPSSTPGKFDLGPACYPTGPRCIRRNGGSVSV